MMEQDQQLESIARHVAKTFESFRDLEDALADINGYGDSSEGTSMRKFLSTIQNNFIRFKMWAGNQAAHQSGPSSLDHRLREAPHLQQQVIYLLKDICESLQDALSQVYGNPDSLDRPHEKERDQDIQDNDSSFADSAQDQESEFSDSASDLEHDISTTLLSTLVLDVGEAIDCLLRLSVAIANPAPHERFRKLGAGPSEDISFYEPYDIAYVRDKFPKISNDLANSLGQSITRRRQFFKYRHAHHEKLASGIETLASNKENDTGRTEVVPKTVASSLPEQFKTLATFDPQAAVIDEDIRSDTGMSQTSYATSAGITSEETDQETCKLAPPLRVPPRPIAAEDGIFECPFCYRMISAKTRTAWKRHVFGDLRPYTCILSYCTESNIDFDRRHNWKSHISEHHWRSWSCPFKCHQLLSSTAELSGHIKDLHLPTGSEEEINSVTTLGEKPAPDDTSRNCTLCGLSVTGLKNYIKHVGRHLEQLALFALPNLETDELERETGSNEQNSVESEIDATSLYGSITSPSMKLAPQQKPVSDLPMEGEEGELDDEEETDSYGYDENTKDLNSLSAIARGKLPVTNGFSGSFQKHAESPDAIQDEQWREIVADLHDWRPLWGTMSNVAPAKQHARLLYDAASKAAEDGRQREAEERVRAEEEARLKFEAELRQAKEKRYQDKEERKQAEELARMRFEAELRKVEENRIQDEVRRKQAEQLLRIRIKQIIQEGEASEVLRLEHVLGRDIGCRAKKSTEEAEKPEKLEGAYIKAEEVAVDEGTVKKAFEKAERGEEELETPKKVDLQRQSQANVVTFWRCAKCYAENTFSCGKVCQNFPCQAPYDASCKVYHVAIRNKYYYKDIINLEL